MHVSRKILTLISMKTSFLPNFSKDVIGVTGPGLPEVTTEEAENAQGGYNPVDGSGTQTLVLKGIAAMLDERRMQDEKIEEDWVLTA